MVIVTVPIYKPALSAGEQDALLQLFDILSAYPICFFTFRNLDLRAYEKLLINKSYSITYFDEQYFNNLSGYNLLMRSKDFYERFSDYAYLLIHQLDAWVFSDQLEFWCRQNYDYIGAPWFDNWNTANPGFEFLGVGNGGFSLRKIQSHLKVLHSFSYIKPFSKVLSEFLKGRKNSQSLRHMIRNLTKGNNTYYRFNDYADNEDKFWGVIAKNNFGWFKTPDMITAAKFSLEIHAQTLYALIDKQIPFGCHALEKYDAAFFRKLVQQSRNGC